ncbi:MAG TPA: TadE family protein [Bryobacteraceae bacterium]|nr:TadE family protein [Bryobacteraceae bacterium]
MESALTLTAFILLMFGLLDFGYAVYAYDFCSYAARVATRYASVNGNAGATQSTVANYVKSQAVGLLPNNLTITMNPTTLSSSTVGDPVTVTVSYNVSPLSGLGLKQAMTVSSTSQLYVVQ